MNEQKMNCLTEAESAHDEIAVFIKKIKFRKKIFGGIDEYEVWKKIRRLDEMYSEALKIQRIQYEALLADRDRRNAMNIRDEAEGIADGEILQGFKQTEQR